MFFGLGESYNIPAVTPCPEAMEWLSKDPKEILAAKERGEVPDKVRRLLGDGYLCMYQNLDDGNKLVVRNTIVEVIYRTQGRVFHHISKH